MKKLISVVLALALVLSLSAVAFAYEAPAGVNSLAIVGQDIPGVGAWNPGDAAGDMTLVADNVYEKVIEVPAATTMTVKFAGNDSWDDSCNLGGSYNGDPITIGVVKNLTNGSGAQNMSLTVDKACTLKFTVDMSAGVSAATVLVTEVVEEAANNVIAEGSVDLADMNATEYIDIAVTGDVTLVVDVTNATPGCEIIVADTYYYYYEDVKGDVGASSFEFALTEGDYTVSLWGYDYANDEYSGASYSYKISYTGEGTATVALPGSSASKAIVFDDETYTATVPANSTMWYAFDDMYDMWYNGVYEQQFTITGAPGFVVEYSVYSVADTNGSASGSFAGNYMGEYAFGITNNTASEQNYVVKFSDVSAEDDDTPSENESVELVSVTDETVTATAPWVYTFTAESTGVLNVKVSDNVAFKIYGLDGVDSESLRLTANSWSAGTDSDHNVTVPGEITVMVWCWGGSAVGETDGQISCTLTFTPDEIEVPMEEYVVSDTTLELGSNYLTMEENAENTLFEFEPTETGVYTFTAPAGTLIGNWGISSYPQDNTADKTNTLVWTCTGVGQSVLVGVAGSDDIELVVTSEEYVAPVEIPWIYYENYYTFDYEIPEGELVEIDVTDDVADVAVLGMDGFYHYGSAYGPLMVADLSDVEIDILGAYGYGQLRAYIYDENGELVAKYDYNEAMFQYATNGLCPVTAELGMMIKEIGDTQGWWNAGGFVFADSAPLNEEDAWMAFCSYVEGTEVGLSNYYVAGYEELCGTFWNPSDPANQMYDYGDGTCGIVYESVAAGTYEFKVTDGTWNNAWGDDGENFVITVEATSDVYILFDSTTGYISVAIIEIDDSEVPGDEEQPGEDEQPGDEEQPGDNEQPGDEQKPSDEQKPGDEQTPVVLSDYRVTGNADFLGNWDPANESGRMVDVGNGIYKITYENVAAGDYEFKITKGSWDENWGSNGPNGDNVKVTVKEAGDVTITFNASTGEISVAVNGEEIPKTNDAGMIALVVLMVLASTTAVVVCSKKKFF